MTEAERIALAMAVANLTGKIETFNNEVFPIFCKGVEIRLKGIDEKVEETIRYQRTQNGAITALSSRIWYLMGGIGLLSFIIGICAILHEHLQVAF